MSVVFRRLALGGGGAKGILHIGALQELSKHQPLVFPNGVYGCSIGSIVATYVAFELPIENMVPLLHKHMSFQRIVPSVNFTHITKILSTKGIFNMDIFETSLKEFFLDAGLDISDKKLSDAKMPLFIISSNITRGCPSLLTGDISIISALKCSCCVPGVFEPQELYGQLYLDGDLFTPCASHVVPMDDETLVITLKKQTCNKMTPKNIENISPLEYIYNIYLMNMTQLYNLQKREGILCLYHPKLFSTTKLEDIDVENVLQTGQYQLRAFLSQRTN
jgi:predicted acylesterase/phospholipase RssA